MLRLKPISQEGLEPLATLLRSDGGRMTDFPAATEPGTGPGRASLGIVRFEPESGADLVVSRLERHPHSWQTFIPISVARYCVVVAPALPDGSPDIEKARGFVGGPGDAIAYPRNVWHASLIVLDEVAEMAVMMWRREAGDDTVVVDLKTPLGLAV